MSKFGTKGELVTADLWLKKMPELDELEGLIEMALIENKINVVNFIEQLFEPQGATLVWILSASSITVHTYPEHKYISLDCYTCGGEGSAIDTVMYIVNNLEINTKKIGHHPRGVDKC
jgi:S-adenosylmethionine/arginine decarboxylase-like enzyme